MCRIFINPNKKMDFPFEDLVEFFSLLEDRGGRDGNGIYMIDRAKIVRTTGKATGLLVDDDVSGRFMFHTRLGTHGTKKIYNVQPLHDGRYAIVHNGIFSLYSFPVKDYLNLQSKHSDSHVILQLIRTRNILDFYKGFLKRDYGVVVVFDQKTENFYLLKTGGSFEYGICDDGKYLYASSSLDYWDVHDVTSINDGMYILGEYGLKQIHKPKTVSYRNYGSGYHARTSGTANDTTVPSVSVPSTTPPTTSASGYQITKDIFKKLYIKDFPCGYNENCKYQCHNDPNYPCFLYTAYIRYQNTPKSEIIDEKPCGNHPDCNNLCGICEVYDKWIVYKMYNTEPKKNVSIEAYCNKCYDTIDCKDCDAYKLHLARNYRDMEVYPDYPCNTHPLCKQQCYTTERECELITLYYQQKDEAEQRIDDEEEEEEYYGMGSLFPTRD